MKKLKQDDTTYSESLKFVTKASFLYFGGKGAGSVLQFVYQVILARLIGAELLGIYYIGLAVSFIVRNCFTFGLDHAMRRFVPRAKNTYEINTLTSTASRISLFISMPGSIVLVVFFCFYGDAIFSIKNISIILSLFICATVFLSLMTIRLASIQGQKIIVPSILVEEISFPASRILIFLILFMCGYKLFGAITAYLLAAIIACILSYIAYIKCTPVAEDSSKSCTSDKELISFAWPMTITMIANTLMIWIGTLILGRYNTPENVAIYAVSARIITFFGLFFVAMNTVLAPVASEYFHLKKQKELKELYKTITFYLLGTILPFMLIIGLFPQAVLNIFGNEFQRGSLCLRILLIGQLINFLAGSSGTLLIMCGKQKALVKIVVVSSVISVILNMLFISRWGIMGAAMASAISFSICNVTQLFFLYLYQKIHPFSLRVASLIIVSGIVLLFYSNIEVEDIYSFKAILQIISVGTIQFLCFLLFATKGRLYKIKNYFFTRENI